MAMMRSLCISIAILAASPHCSGAAGSVETWGEKFVPAHEVVFAIPVGELDHLPAELPLYTKKTTAFGADGVTWIIDNAVSDEKAGKVLKEKLRQNPSALTTGRTTLHEDEHFRLVLNPSDGVILFTVQPIEAAKKRRLAKPSGLTNFLAVEHFHATMRALVSKIGIPESEIERKGDGDYKIVGSDGQRYPNHQTEPELYLRTVTYNRKSPSGYPMTSGTAAYSINLERFVSGDWKRIFIQWPTLTTNGFVGVPRTTSDLKAKLGSGKGLWDYNNEFGPQDAKKVLVTAVRLVYSTSSNGESSPVMCLDCDAETPRGNQYAVVFIPLVKRAQPVSPPPKQDNQAL